MYTAKRKKHHTINVSVAILSTTVIERLFAISHYLPCSLLLQCRDARNADNPLASLHLT